MLKKSCFAAIAALWALLTLGAWFGPKQAVSDAERRPLAQLPEMKLESLLKGRFMADFEDYSLDQFPLRDGFRRIKSLFHFYALGQKDNNGIYIADGYAAKQEYPMSEKDVDHLLERLNYVKEKYLGDSRVFMAVVPDKNTYLAEASGHLAMDYDALYARVQEKMPWASHIELRDSLTIQDYYYTDTHWRQEKLLAAAGQVAEALGVTAPKAEDFTVTALERPFYGVYYGQAALPMEPETVYLMESELLKNCTVYDWETERTGSIYDLSKLESRDLYDVYLSGAKSLLTIENPQGQPGKELIVFRDSFGSSLIPLLVPDYERVTVVDIRYIRIDFLDRFLEFRGQDVLMLYSTLVMNSSAAIQ